MSGLGDGSSSGGSFHGELSSWCVDECGGSRRRPALPVGEGGIRGKRAPLCKATRGGRSISPLSASICALIFIMMGGCAQTRWGASRLCVTPKLPFCPSVTTGLSRSPPTFLPVYLPTYIHSFVHTDEHTYINTYRYIDLASISPLPSSSNMTS